MTAALLLSLLTASPLLSLTQDEILERQWPAFEYALDPDSYALFGRNSEATCLSSHIYLVERDREAPFGEADARVVEVIHGPPRERVNISPVSQRIEATRLVVYLDEHGQTREHLHYSCLGHPESHPYTRWIRAIVRVGWLVEGIQWQTNVQGRIELLSSDDLMDVWAACTLALSDDDVDTWDRLGAFLSEALRPGHSLHTHLARPGLRPQGRPFATGLEYQAALQEFMDSGDRRTSGCRTTLHTELNIALHNVKRVEYEPGWAEEALRVFAEATSHPDLPLRRSACRSLRSHGHDLQCVSSPGPDGYQPDPAKLRALRDFLGMPPLPEAPPGQE
jgi:hypothetical protein